VTTSAAPAASVKYSTRRQATITVTNGDGLVAAAGAVWVKTDDGRAVRVDPATNRVTDEIKLDTVADESQHCQGIGTDGVSVWACATGDEGTGVAQIDPKARRVVRRVPVGKVFDQLALPSTSRGIWVLTADGTSASVVEPATGRVTAYPLGSRYLQLAALADRVVATSSTKDAVIVLDAANGAVVGRISLPKPRMAALAGTDLWIDTEQGLTRVTRDLVVRSVYADLGAGSGGDLVAAAGAVWLRESDGTITKVDPASGRLVERITPEQPLTAGSLLVAFGSIWTTSSDQGTVVRLRLET
jgi:streptogramin lyase